MTYLTFKDYLRIMDEGSVMEDSTLDAEITKLQADISAIDSTMATRNNPLMQQRMRLQKMLGLKQKQKETEDKKNASSTTPQVPGQTNPGAPQGSSLTAPGSTGANTPGQ